MVHVVIYDALGATHARTNPSSAGGFSWLWDKSIKGGPKAEMLEECTYEDAVNVQAPITKMFGMTRFILDAVTPWHGEMDEDLVNHRAEPSDVYRLLEVNLQPNEQRRAVAVFEYKGIVFRLVPKRYFEHRGSLYRFIYLKKSYAEARPKTPR